MKRLQLKCILFFAILMLISRAGYSQLNPMGSMYYQNPYLANPALVGLEENWELNGAYKAQWTAIDGAPAMQAITLGYRGVGKKVGLGLNFYNEGAGVIRRTSFKATYAYHLPLNDESSKLDFGLSAGITDEWINFGKVKGDLSDRSLYNFNERKVYFDGDFGIAFRNNQLTIQGGLPNLKRFFDRDLQRAVADRSLYMAAVSYKFLGKDGSTLTAIEPRFTYRGVENYKDIMDLGVNVQFYGNKLLLSGMYHSTNSVTVGAGTTYKNQLTILCQYTTNTSDLQNYSNGEAEIAIKYNFK